MTNSLLFVALALTSSISISQAQFTCQSNDCDGCCTTSGSCMDEHTLISEDNQCRDESLDLETPLILGRLEQCPYSFPGGFSQCPNSYVSD